MAHPALIGGRLRSERYTQVTASFVRAVMTPAGLATSVGATVVLLLALASAARLLGVGQAWQDVEWFVAIVTAVTASWLGARDATGRERRVRALVGASIALFAGGQVAASLASQLTPVAPGGWPDLFRFAAALPALAALRTGTAGRLRRSQEVAVYLDTLVILGTMVATVVSFAAVKWFLRYIQTHTFEGFGWYRIALGILILIFFR